MGKSTINLHKSAMFNSYLELPQKLLVVLFLSGDVNITLLGIYNIPIDRLQCHRMG